MKLVRPLEEERQSEVLGLDELTAQQATRETADGKDRNVKLLAFEQAVVAHRIIVVRP